MASQMEEADRIALNALVSLGKSLETMAASFNSLKRPQSNGTAETQSKASKLEQVNNLHLINTSLN